jgi:small-conductance mechanosensitive channel
MDPATPSILAAAVASSLVVVGPLVRLVLRRRRLDVAADDVGLLTWPVRLAAALFVARVAAEAGSEPIRSLAGLALTISLAWVALRGLRVAERVVFRRLSIDVTDNLRARSRRTQLELLRRIGSVLVVVFALVVVLITLTPLSELGPSLVAYGGIIGVVLGIALRSPLESLAAGVIVAVTEPIRIDDVVVVEGEWGRVEQIGLGQVVVRLWDDRRLVLPTSRFVTEPFENWTRSSANVTGTVLMWFDHTVDVDELRTELHDVVQRSGLWDGRAFVLQVVDLGERAVQLRALVTARNASDLWDLRCHVREEVLATIRRRGLSLPVIRLDEREHERDDDRVHAFG